MPGAISPNLGNIRTGTLFNLRLSTSATPSHNDEKQQNDLSSQEVGSVNKTRVHTVRHVRTSDIASCQIGSFKRWLHFQLSRMGVVASGKNQTGRCSMKDVDADLQPCLQDVLNVFNERDADGRVKLEDGKPVENKFYHAIMDELAAYANATNEQMRYVHFVKTSNMVLDALSSMEMPSSNSAPDKNPAMFMVNSPTRMYSVYKGKTYCQTPAILLGYKKHLQRVYPEASESVPIGDLVKDGPSQPFPWTQALLFVEMESFSEAVPAPPLAYTPRVLAECQSAARDEGRLDSTDSLSFTDNDSSTTAAAKRAAGPACHSRPSKRRKTDFEDDDIPFNVTDNVTHGIRKLADSAAEAMCNCYGRNHVLGFILKGSTLNLWIFDHEGPIQLMGFDFIQDFPHFLLLLYVLQRFSPQDFGFVPGFEECPAENEATYSMDLTSAWIFEDGLKRQVKLEGMRGEGVPRRYGLNSRSTGVRFGTATITQSGRQDEIRKVALKLSWKDTSRKCERECIDKARNLIGSSRHATEDDTDPRNFLPEILAERKYTDFDTSIIRSHVLLDSESSQKGACYPYMIVMPRYEPIRILVKESGFQMLNAFLALIYCHAVLWTLGIEHGDISEGNLMVDPSTGYPKLCDFDLSQFEDDTRPSGFSNTGTWTFMAAELLTDGAMEGFIKRRYRHEVESFIAVLVWLLLRYDKGRLISNPPLSEWDSTSHEICAAKRKGTFEDIITGELAKPGWLSSAIWDGLTYAVCELEQLNTEFGYLLSKSRTAARRNVPMDAGDVKRLEHLNGIGYAGEVLRWLFTVPASECSKWAALIQKLLPSAL